MRISRDVVAAPSWTSGIDLDILSIFTKDGKLKTGDWSSLIGIVTAICGNILISIALNTQRYAHIKLSQQYQERQRLLRRAQKRSANQQRYSDEGYGTSSPANSTGKERKRLNGAVTLYRDEPEDDDVEGSEDQPLLGTSMHSEATETNEDDNEQSEEGAKQEARTKSYLKSPYWWAGIVLMTIGEAGNFLAYGFAPASIVSPLGVVALISNCIIAPFFLKEPFRKRDLLGVLIAVGGAVTVVLSANDSNPKLGPEEIWRLIGTWEFETYLSITVVLILGLMWASSRYGAKIIFIDLGLVGLFGGYTALSTKGVASLLSYTVFRALTFPITYLLVFVLVFTAIMQIKYVNRALKRFDATQVIPTQFVLFTLSVIIGSAVLYRDFEKESPENAGKFVGGCAMTFLGVYFITSARNKDEEDDEVLEEDEEAIRLATEGVYHDEPELHTEARPDILRGTTAPLARTIPVNGYKQQAETSPSETPSRVSFAEQDLPQITRTSTSQSISVVVNSDLSEPGSLAQSSPTTNNPWVPPEQQSSAARRSMQKLLNPLNKIAPKTSSELHLPSTIKTTTSEPILPTEATIQPERPHTPTNASHDDHLPIIPHTPDGAHLLSRHSISDFIPGPFTSTLSSPLSAIVADSLRRGVDVKSLKPRRRRKLPGSPRPGGTLRNHSTPDVATLTQVDDLSRSLTAEETPDQHTPARRNRIRSLSNTFGDLFGSKKRVARAPIDDAEEGRAGVGPDEGPS